MSSDNEHINSVLRSLPDTPGVYQFFNKKGEIIYVGKAKNLKRRVSSYFMKSHHDSAKVRIMVSKIDDLRYVLVESESDALLLENNLIKKYKPRYNILLKDDKTFPWICIRNEPYPRVFSTRNVVKDGSVYFGPYTSVVMVRTLLQLIKELFQLRSCTLILSEAAIGLGKYKVCLEFHMGNCKAPCVGEQTSEDYATIISQVKEILKGNTSQVIQHLKLAMLKLATDLKFEEADILKSKIGILENYQSKSTIVSPTINNVDVFSIVEEEPYCVVNFLKVMNGAIIQSHTVELIKRLDEDKEELLSYAISEIRDKFNSLSREILVPFDLKLSFDNLSFSVPKIGDKKKLLELSERNARYYIIERRNNSEKANPEARFDRIMETLKKDLRLPSTPSHIECFDNSNIQGTNPVSSCVVFKNARPSKSDYRHFNIKTVEGPNDFASMEEVIFRRYHRMQEEQISLPQLIIIDGGKGQLHSALNSLEKLHLRGKIAIIGIAKRLEEIYFPGDSVPLYLDKQSESLKLIQRMRDEAHRFGITHHRQRRSKSMIGSSLDQIPGVGAQTKDVLLEKYSSVSNLAKVPIEDLVALIGTKRANIVFNYLHQND